MKATPSRSPPASRFLLVFGICWALLSAVFLLIGIHTLRLERKFEAEGVTVPGIVTSKRVSEKRETDRETKRQKTITTYYVQYKFATAQGREMEDENSVSGSTWQSLSEQDAIQVQYLPSQPAESRIAGESQTALSYGFTGLGAAGVLAGLAAVFAWIRRRIQPAR